MWCKECRFFQPQVLKKMKENRLFNSYVLIFRLYLFIRFYNVTYIFDCLNVNNFKQFDCEHKLIFFSYIFLFSFSFYRDMQRWEERKESTLGLCNPTTIFIALPITSLTIRNQSRGLIMWYITSNTNSQIERSKNVTKTVSFIFQIHQHYNSQLLLNIKKRKT